MILGWCARLFSNVSKQMVLFVDETGRSRGLQALSSITFDRQKYDLVCVTGNDKTDQSPVHPAHPVYRLQPKGEAYRRAKQAHAAAVEARRSTRLKQVHFTTKMAVNDYNVHLSRARFFLSDKGLRTRIVAEGPHIPGALVDPDSASVLASKKAWKGKLTDICKGIQKELRDCGVPEAQLEECGSNAVSFTLKPVKNGKKDD